MGFATDLLFCTTYPLLFADKEDPAWMTFRNLQNHPTSFSADVLLVCQLLAQDCSPRLSPVMHLRAATHLSSDLPKSSQLPAAEDTGCLQLRESLWPRFLVDKSGSILEAGGGMWGLDVPVIGDFNTPMWVRV